MTALASPVAAVSCTEGMVPVPGGEVWFRRVGGGAGSPLVVVHGGPGSPHDYLLPLLALGEGREVIFYDQLGCGRSTPSRGAHLWTVDRFVDELGALVQALGLAHPHLLGHSWGSIVVAEYARRHPTQPRSLVLVSPCLEMPRVIADLTRLRAELPPGLLAVIERHERAGDTDAASYQLACHEFYARHVCRLRPWPACLARGFEGWALEAYRTLWGPAELWVTGTLKSYDATRWLSTLRLPVMLTAGRHDEMTPAAVASYQARIPGAEMVVFENSSHLAHIEEGERFLETVASFLTRVDATRSVSALETGAPRG